MGRAARLGVLIREARPLRLRDLRDDPRSVGFPPGHPPMGSFLGVPILLRGVAYDRAAHLKELMEVFATTSTETFYVEDDCPAAGQTIAALGLRKASGASIIAVNRAGKSIVNPMPDVELLTGDVLVLVGSHPQLDAAHTLLEGGTAA